MAIRIADCFYYAVRTGTSYFFRLGNYTDRQNDHLRINKLKAESTSTHLKTAAIAICHEDCTAFHSQGTPVPQVALSGS